MDDWLTSLSAENNGYKHYYTLRKKAIQNGFVSGMSQENYWFNCGRLIELQYINALSVNLLKDYAKKTNKKHNKEDESEA